MTTIAPQINPAFWINAIRNAMHCTDCAAKQTVLANAADHLERYVQSIAQGDSLAQQAVPVAPAERVAQLTAHRACHSAEHDPVSGRIHGYCIVCGIPWPCEYAGKPPAAAVEVTDEPAGYYIASFRSGPKGYALWWGPNNAGYTTDIATAGIYPDYQRGYHDANDNVPVPVAFVRALRARTMIDIGDTGNGCLWNEANLRAALVAALGAGKS